MKVTPSFSFSARAAIVTQTSDSQTQGDASKLSYKGFAISRVRCGSSDQSPTSPFTARLRLTPTATPWVGICAAGQEAWPYDALALVPVNNKGMSTAMRIRASPCRHSAKFDRGILTQCSDFRKFGQLLWGLQVIRSLQCRVT